MSKTIKYHIELVKGKVRWHYRVKSSSDGQILSSSQRYYSRTNCLREATRISRAFGIPIKDQVQA